MMKDYQLTRLDVSGIGLGVILFSFICQLIGHSYHEEFKVKPNLFHGFIAAPILESTSLVYRIGGYPPGLLEKVNSVREKALIEHKRLIVD